MKKRTKRESPKRVPKEAPARREPVNSRRSNEAWKKTANSRDTSNRGSTGCDRSKPRGKEESVAEELLRDRREDLDREQVEIEIVADTRESREIEDRRETLQVEFILDTFRRILDHKNRDLREHTDLQRRDPENSKYEALIA